jgi:hypothetical protein
LLVTWGESLPCLLPQSYSQQLLRPRFSSAFSRRQKWPLLLLVVVEILEVNFWETGTPLMLLLLLFSIT